jgi:hypothetical protein
MTNTPKNRAICVLGMHRSGTSAVTRAINLLGVYLGEPEKLMPPGNDNPKGFWEHLDIVDIHERILNSLSRNYRDVWPMPDRWWTYPEIQPLQEELLIILRREFADRALWGWKDPRTCLMLPLWGEIQKELDVEISYVITVRNPLDIAISLRNRNNYTVNESLLIWQLHTLSALVGTKGSKRIIIRYDNLLENWKSCIKRIATTLEIPWPTNDSLLSEQMEAFLDPSLRHSQSTFENLTGNVEIPESIVTTYRLCLDAEMNTDFLNSKEFIDKIDKLYLEYVIYTKDLQLRLKDEQIRLKNEQISAIINTWSWRVTAPLRWFGCLLIRTGILK